MPDESTMPVMPPVADDAVSSGSVSSDGVSDSSSAATGTSAVMSNNDVAAENTNTGAVDTSFSKAPIDDQLANSAAVVVPMSPEENEPVKQRVSKTDIPTEVARKIEESHNVLIALSSDPSVDELAAAIGLSIYLDRMGKRATAIYSGSTPNALEFLKPEETFESTADALQDFVIALNKEKADHLRYKLDGDYVKIYITPYRSRISEDDLDFSYGDYNVDLVLALDVANGIDLDDALREHGRIMHDAVIINITTGNPGKFGEIEWSNKKASSVSEMIAGLLYGIKNAAIEKGEATAFLTGIVAATNRFSNAGTTPETMRMASRLMESGANQQLISKNITPDIDNELFSTDGTGFEEESRGESETNNETMSNDPTKLDIGHGYEGNVEETKEVSDNITEKESTLLDDLKAAEASLAAANAETTPDIDKQPVRIDASDALMTDENIVPSDHTPTIDEGIVNIDNTPKMEDNAVALSDTSNVSDGTVATSDVSSVNDSAVVISDASNASDSTVAMSDEPNRNENVMAPNGISNLDENVAVSNNSSDVDMGGTTSSEAPDNNAMVPDSNLVAPTVSASNSGSSMNDAAVPMIQEGIISAQPEKTIAPSENFSLEASDGGTEKYSKMLEDALTDVNSAATVPDMLSVNNLGENTSGDVSESLFGTSGVGADSVSNNTIGTTFDNNVKNVNMFDGANPAATVAPTVPANPEINGVPSINYMPMPGDEVLPPPPAPPIDMSVPPVAPVTLGGGADTNAGASLSGTVEPPVPVASNTGQPSAAPVVPAVPAAVPAAAVPAAAAPAVTLPTVTPAQPMGPAVASTTPTPAADPGAFRIPGM